MKCPRCEHDLSMSTTRRGVQIGKCDKSSGGCGFFGNFGHVKGAPEPDKTPQPAPKAAAQPKPTGKGNTSGSSRPKQHKHITAVISEQRDGNGRPSGARPVAPGRKSEPKHEPEPKRRSWLSDFLNKPLG